MIVLYSPYFDVIHHIFDVLFHLFSLTFKLATFFESDRHDSDLFIYTKFKDITDKYKRCETTKRPYGQSQLPPYLWLII